jgi:hypothetical protein
LNIELPITLTAKMDEGDKAKEFIEKMVKDTIGDAFKALRLSSPRAYWGWLPSAPSTGSDITVTGSTATVTSVSVRVSFGDYPKDPDTGEFQGIQKMLDDLDAAVNGFHTNGKTTRDKVLDINNYLVKLVTYDPNATKQDESRYSHDAYGALADPKHIAVCDGYSKAFLLLCEKEEIECVVVMGAAVPSMVNHAWNYVKMDNGKWYAMDVTWNDRSDNAYFLKGGSSFFTEHQQGVFLSAGLSPDHFNSPVISKDGYDEDTFDHEMYILTRCLLAAAILGILCLVIYKHAKRNR